MKTYSKERVINFSDAIFSIAATILVLDLAVPSRREMVTEGVLSLFGERTPAFIGFFVSFFVIIMFWRAHMRNLSYAKEIGRRLLSINIFTLLFIVLLPFTTGLFVVGYDMASAFRIYCFNIMALGICDYLTIRQVHDQAPNGSTMLRTHSSWYQNLALNVIIVWGLSALLADSLPFLSRWLFILIFVNDFFINRFWTSRSS